MIEQKIRNISGALSRSSIFISRSLLESSRIERNLEKRSLVLKRKIVEERGRTLKNLESRDKGTQKGGVLGGALGLLGLGGGGGLLRRGLRRTPKSPSQLLRMQKGTSNLSRVGRFGRLARPLAAVGTGLDFIGRRAEGQSNVQAGVGAAGGLAGSIAGAKAGAFFGSFAGPVGTIVGGAGGAIIGSLAGGRIADLFTGANRRRQFEEERVLLRSQKTLFSEALDDFDRALDKFEDAAPLLVLRRDDDEEVVGARRRRPRPPVPFFQRPAVKTTGRVLAASALIALAAFQLRKGKIDTKTYNKILEKVIAKRPFLKGLNEKEQIAAIGKIIERSLPKAAQQRIRMNASPFLTKSGRIVKGQKGVPKQSTGKTNVIKKRIKEKAAAKKDFEEGLKQDISKAEKIRLNRENFIKNNKLRDPDKLDIKNREGFRQNRADVEILERKGSITPETANKAYQILNKNKSIRAEQIRKYARELEKFINNNPNFDSNNVMDRGRLNQMLNKLDLFTKKKRKIPFDSDKLLMKDIPKRLREILKRRDVEDMLEGIIPDDVINKVNKLSSNLEPSDSTTIASRLSNNLFLMGGNTDNNQGLTSQPVINVDGGGTIVATNPFDAVAANILFESTLTT